MTLFSISVGSSLTLLFVLSSVAKLPANFLITAAFS